MKSKFKYLWNHIEIAVIILFFSLMCLVTFGSVITRYFFSFTFSWTEQFSRICFVIITFAGISWAASKGAHLKVTVLTAVMPHKVEQVMILFGDINLWRCNVLPDFKNGQNAVAVQSSFFFHPRAVRFGYVYTRRNLHVPFCH